MQKLKVLGVNKADVEFAAKVLCRVFSGSASVDSLGPDTSGKGLYTAFVSYMSMYEADYEPGYKAHTRPALTPCNHILALNPELSNPENLKALTAGLEGGGWLVLNVPETSSGAQPETPSRAPSEGPIDFDRFAGYRLAFIDAVGVVASVVGRPNLQDGMAQAGSTYFCGQDKFSRYKIFAMLGALSRVLGEPSLAEVKRFLADDLDMDWKQSGTMDDCEVALKLVQGGYDRVIIHGFVPRAMSYGKLS